MKKFLVVFSVIAIVGCAVPANAHEVHRGNYHYSYNSHVPPRHEVVVHHYNDRHHYRRPPRPHYSYHYTTYRTGTTGAVLTGIAAGAIITGIFTSIVH